MFNLQPGQGLGATSSEQLAFGLGSGEIEVIQPPVVQPIPTTGRGSGPTKGIKRYKDVYKDYHEDVQRESNRARILREDQEIIDVIVALLTKGIL